MKKLFSSNFWLPCSPWFGGFTRPLNLVPLVALALHHPSCIARSGHAAFWADLDQVISSVLEAKHPLNCIDERKNLFDFCTASLHQFFFFFFGCIFRCVFPRKKMKKCIGKYWQCEASEKQKGQNLQHRFCHHFFGLGV